MDASDLEAVRRIAAQPGVGGLMMKQAVYFKALAETGSETQAKQILVDTICPPSKDTQGLRDKAAELNRAWITTGYYTWEEMAHLTVKALEISKTASTAAVETYKVGVYGINLTAAVNRYFGVAGRAQDWVETWQKAREDNAIIDAPGLKRWAIDLINAAADLMREIDLAACETTWLDRFISSLFYAVESFYRAVVAVGKAIVEAGRKVIRAVGWFWPYLKWGAVGVAALAVSVFTYNKLVVVAERGRSGVFDFSKIFPKRKPPTQVSGARRRRRR